MQTIISGCVYAARSILCLTLENPNPLHFRLRLTDLADMFPQDRTYELVRDRTTKVVTEVSSSRLAVVFTKFAQSAAHSPQSLWISDWQRQL